MSYIHFKDFEKNPIPKGKYTLIYVGESMALTYKVEVEVLEFNEIENYAQYTDLVEMVFKVRRKRKLSALKLKSSMLLLSGWDLGLMVDTDLNSFKGNACLNFVGNPEEVKKKIEGYNKNSFVDLGIITIADEENPTNEKVLYPEKANLNHAVINRLMN